MPKTGDAAKPDSVALLAEGVDRNDNDVDKFIASFGRPPRGGRG